MYNLSLRSPEEPVSVDGEEDTGSQRGEHASPQVSQCLSLSRGVPFIYLSVFCSAALSVPGTWLTATRDAKRSQRVPFLRVETAICTSNHSTPRVALSLAGRASPLAPQRSGHTSDREKGLLYGAWLSCPLFPDWASRQGSHTTLCPSA